MQVLERVKLNSYSNANVFLSLCHMRISVFWGQEHLINRSVSKRYLKSNIATWVEKSSTSRAIHACDTGFYWSSENALHERFIASNGVWDWMKNATAHRKAIKKMLGFEYEFRFSVGPTTDLDGRFKNLRHFSPCVGCSWEYSGFPHDQNNSFIRCIMSLASIVQINMNETPHGVRSSWMHFDCIRFLVCGQQDSEYPQLMLHGWWRHYMCRVVWRSGISSLNLFVSHTSYSY